MKFINWIFKVIAKIIIVIIAIVVNFFELLLIGFSYSCYFVAYIISVVAKWIFEKLVLLLSKFNLKDIIMNRG